MPNLPSPNYSHYKRVVKSKAALPTPKPPKRENIFSKSRDTREDRGARQMKTTRNSQTLTHR